VVAYPAHAGDAKRPEAPNGAVGRFARMQRFALGSHGVEFNSCQVFSECHWFRLIFGCEGTIGQSSFLLPPI
jgi:hypothetical protein